MKQYDLIVIGAGPAGYVSAIRAAQLGLKTAIAEKNRLGGTCLNRGCIPTKALLHSAQSYASVQEMSALGIEVKDVSYDIQKIHARKREVVKTLTDGVEQLLKANGVDILCGQAKVTAADTVEVEGVCYQTDKILVAAGSYPAKPPIPGLELDGVVTSDDLLEGTPVDYQSLIIIGGGVIGVEMASVYAALGCKVTIVEGMERMVSVLDKEFSQNLKMNFKKKGVDVFLNAKVTSVEKSDEGLTVHFESKGKEQSVSAQGVLVSVGRRPNTAGLFAEECIPKMNRGFLTVDHQYETSIKGIYAVGDAIGGIQLAHKAEAEGLAAVAMMCGREPETNPAYVPSCIYTSPEIASVGITADEAKAQGLDVKKAKYLMSGNGKSIIEGESRGFIKVVFDAKTEKILGIQMMCGRATDLISEFTGAIANGLTRSQLLAGMRPHPSFCEGITEAMEAVEGMSIHSAPVRK